MQAWEKDKTKLQMPSWYCLHKVNPIAKYTLKVLSCSNISIYFAVIYLLTCANVEPEQKCPPGTALARLILLQNTFSRFFFVPIFQYILL